MSISVVYLVAIIWMLVPLSIFWTIATDKKSITRKAAWWAVAVLAVVEAILIALFVLEIK